MKRAIVLVFALLPAVAGCTKGQIYNAIRDNRIQDCENRPIPQQEHCRSLYRTSYEEYARGLEEILAETQ